MAEWKLVPCEASYDMKEAAWVASRDSDKPAPFNQLADGIAAAIAATPPMPAEEVEKLARVIYAAKHRSNVPEWETYVARAVLRHFGAVVEGDTNG